jgi:DNA-3-methyladenine glycosylase
MGSSSISSSASASAGHKGRKALAQDAVSLGREFFERHTLWVAKKLLGKLLIVQDDDGGRTVTRIVETEAYRGKDPASHSARGKTPRASTLFGPPARAYVYFCYGMHEMLNFVTEPEDRAGAVLIRAVEPVEGVARLRARRRLKRLSHSCDLTNGPGKLCQALGIRMSDNRASLLGGRLRVADDGFKPGKILASPRVGISSATGKFWRFFIAENPCVSRARENKMARPA